MVTALIQAALNDQARRRDELVTARAREPRYPEEGWKHCEYGHRLNRSNKSGRCSTCRIARALSRAEYGGALLARIAVLEEALEFVANAGNLPYARKVARRALGRR